MAMVSIRRGIAASPDKAAARESSSDETLIRRIAEGDQLAMRTLFARHRVALYRWLLRLGGDEALAEDLLSEVFLAVWRQADRFEGRSSVSTWLLAIARNKALSTPRSRTDAELDEESISNVPDTADDPEVALLKKNRAELLRQSIARLSPKHREVIDLVYYHGKAVTEGRDSWYQHGHGQDAHVLRAQAAGRVGYDCIAGPVDIKNGTDNRQREMVKPTASSALRD
jgi:RNA polymerase sigma-70 factor, ECF subfamily